MLNKNNDTLRYCHKKNETSFTIQISTKTGFKIQKRKPEDSEVLGLSSEARNPVKRTEDANSKELIYLSVTTSKANKM